MSKINKIVKIDVEPIKIQHLIIKKGINYPILVLSCENRFIFTEEKVYGEKITAIKKEKINSLEHEMIKESSIEVTFYPDYVTNVINYNLILFREIGSKQIGKRKINIFDIFKNILKENKETKEDKENNRQIELSQIDNFICSMGSVKKILNNKYNIVISKAPNKNYEPIEENNSILLGISKKLDNFNDLSYKDLNDALNNIISELYKLSRLSHGKKEL